MKPDTPLLVAMFIGWSVFGITAICVGAWSLVQWIDVVNIGRPWNWNTMKRLFCGFFVILLPTLLLVLILISISYSQSSP